MLILHIGLPKTATTFLQHRILARSPDLDFVHRARGEAEAAICWRFRRLAEAGPLVHLVVRQSLVRRLRARGAAGGRMLVSDENITMHGARFWRGQGPSPERLARRLVDLGPRLGSGFAPMRVVIGIRRQDQWLASRYAESSKHFREFGQADFDRRMAAIAAGTTLAGPLQWLDHHAARASFAAAFGAENVFILPVERLAVAEGEVLTELGAFLDGAALLHRARRKPAAPARRRNRLSEGENRWRLKRDGTPLVLAPELEAALRARFAASNRALAAELPLGFEP